MRKKPFTTGAPALLGILLSASSLLMVGCGGGGAGDSTPASPRPPAASRTPVRTSSVGFWRGTLTSTNPTEAARAIAIVASPRDVRVITEAGFHYVTGAGTTFLGAGHAPAGKTFPDGSSTAAMTAMGRFLDAQGRSSGSAGATLTFTCQVGGDNLRFVSSTTDPGYGSPLTMADLSGTYRSRASENSLGLPLTLVLEQGTGSFTLPAGDTYDLDFTLPAHGTSAVALSLRCTPAGLVTENPVPGTGSCLPAQGGQTRILTFGAAGGTRSFCGTFTRNE